MLWRVALNYVVKTGDLTVIDALGKTHRFGVAGQTPKSVIRLHDKALHHRLFLNPDLYLGEAYMDGTLTLEEGDLRDLLSVLAINLAAMPQGVVTKLRDALTPIAQRIQQYNPLGLAQKKVAPHYDLSDQLYELFLDKDMHYSCAYFTEKNNSLEQAQQDKIRHIVAKLHLAPGMKVLDIGSGWGGMAMHLAREKNAEVTGVSLSGGQVKKAAERVKDAGLERSVKFHQIDYRQADGQFDRIVSVGMMEHLGAQFYGEFFAKIKSLLKPSGVALLHCIGRFDGPGTTNPWLRKYIFPGGYAPALSEVMKAVEKSGLLVSDIEILRLHYAYTLAAWHKRFRKEWDVAAKLYDERFCRMWEFYLVGSEMEFRYMGTMVFQMQVVRDIEALPVTRDYMLDAERAYATQANEVKAA